MLVRHPAERFDPMRAILSPNGWGAMGAVAMDEWTVYRTSGEALTAMAALPLRSA